MNRREVLTRTGAFLGAFSLSGCLERYGVPSGNGETDRQPTLANQSFEIVGVGCGRGANEAAVDFESAAVVVTGTVPGPNACYVAELADASYDPEAGSLDVTVASAERQDAEACAQCITDVEYEATFEFDGGLPESVSVTHDARGESTTVASAERDSTPAEEDAA